MIASPTVEALEALLVPLSDNPLCTTLGCSGCELPHLRPQLEAVRETCGPEEFASSLVDLLDISLDAERPDTAQLRRGLGAISALTPDLLPRSVRAFLQLHEIKIRHRDLRGNSRALFLPIMRILASWPELCREISCGQISAGRIPQALVDFLEANSFKTSKSGPGKAS